MGHWIEETEGLHQYYLVCNYGVTSSMHRKIYATGPPGSDCKTGRDPKYPDLCSPLERYMSEVEEMEMEYDLAHGIETSVETSSSKSKRSRSSRRSNSTRATSTTKVNRMTCTTDSKIHHHHNHKPAPRSHRRGDSHSHPHANANSNADAH